MLNHQGEPRRMSRRGFPDRAVPLAHGEITRVKSPSGCCRKERLVWVERALNLATGAGASLSTVAFDLRACFHNNGQKLLIYFPPKNPGAHAARVRWLLRRTQEFRDMTLMLGFGAILHFLRRTQEFRC
jgi:hypothetical protein